MEKKGIPELNIGDKVRIGRTDYTIVVKFLGATQGKSHVENDVLYVGRKENSYGCYSYANIIYYNESEKQFSLRS